MDPSTGRFVSVDPFAGDPQAPVSLHRYLYAGIDPVNHIDPTGMLLEGLAFQSNVHALYSSISMVTFRAALPWVIRGAAVVALSIAIGEIKDEIFGKCRG